ncbi:MAG: hypothetical protein U0T75_13090 [Chitinophagales bacterium]
MDTQVEDMILQVDRLFEDGEYAEGRQVLEDILEMEPDCGRAHNHIGWLYYYKLDNYRKAEYHYKLAIKFSPRFPAAWINYCNFLNYLGRFEELKKHAAIAMAVPGVSKAVMMNLLGQAHEAEGLYIQALDYYHEAYMKALNKTDYKLFLENFNRVKEKTSAYSRFKLFFAKTKAAAAQGQNTK